MDRIIELLKKLEEAHNIYIRTDERRRRKIFDACDWVFVELVSLTSTPAGDPIYYDPQERPVGRSFFEALLIGGLDFLLTEYGDEEERILGAFKSNQSEKERQTVQRAQQEGILAWQMQGDTFTPLLYKGRPTMDQVRLRKETKPIPF